MKWYNTFLVLAIAAASFACGNDTAKEAEAQAEAEAQRLDSISQEIETSVEAVETNVVELQSALDSLDALFPEEE